MSQQSTSLSDIEPKDEVSSVPSISSRRMNFYEMITSCSSMVDIFRTIERLAVTKSNVLILGESGTGKELVARALHKLSGRKGRLVPVNCGAIPEEILESELFGPEKGAFTGAVSSRAGRFQLAHGGTIFLDEIAEMSPKLQVKLLRVLQERLVDPVGSTRSIEVDVRVVAATNVDLVRAVESGAFREDLFYRLSVVPICLPPLRERGEDALILGEFFLQRACENLGRSQLKFSPEFANWIMEHTWPGNIRELENLMERLAILVDRREITVADLPDYMRQRTVNGLKVLESSLPAVNLPPTGIDLNEFLGDLEYKLIWAALDRTAGDKGAAADLLGLKKAALLGKLKEHDF